MNTYKNPAWWRDVLDRSWRQSYQVLIPVFALAISGGITGVDFGATLGAVIVAALVVIVRALTGVRAADTDPLWVRAIDRAVSAAAASLLALLTTDGFDLLNTDWGSTAVAMIGSVGLALGATFITPPPPVVAGDPEAVPYTGESGLQTP